MGDPMEIGTFARADRDSPAELAQPRVADAEVMPHLVDDRAPHLLDHVRLAVTDRTDGTAVDRDPVGEGAGVERRTPGQRNSLVEPEQTPRPVLVLDRDGHVAHQLAQLLGDPVERLADHRLETLRLHLDHGPSVRRTRNASRLTRHAQVHGVCSGVLAPDEEAPPWGRTTSTAKVWRTTCPRCRPRGWWLGR